MKKHYDEADILGKFSTIKIIKLCSFNMGQYNEYDTELI